MKKTYREVIDFVNAASVYVRANDKNNKLKYALEKMIKKATTVYAGYSDRVEELRVDNCAVDKDGVILQDDRGQFKFTKEGLKAFNKGQRDLAKEEVDIEPFLVAEKDLPKELTEQQREAFTDFVIAPKK